MAITTYAGMQIVPEKFSEYTLNRTTELNRFVNSGIAVNDAIVAQLINGTPQGGRFIMLPQYNALEGDDDVFGESSVTVKISQHQQHTRPCLCDRKLGEQQTSQVSWVVATLWELLHRCWQIGGTQKSRQSIYQF